MDQGQMAYVALKFLRECHIQLRPVDKRTVEYLELKDSIKQNGLWQPILVRPVEDGVYEVVDGFYRYNCCKDLHLKEVPCLIRSLSDRDVLIVQIQTNAVRLETDPMDYARQIWRIIKVDGEMTIGQMAHLLKKSPAWVKRMLSMHRLTKKASTAVQRGQVSISSAYEISRLPPNMQNEMLPHAMVIPASEFIPVIRAKIRKLREAIRTGRREDYYLSFIEPVPYLRKMVQLLDELKLPVNGADLITRTNAKTAMEGWRLCMDWILHLDPDSVAIQKTKLAKRYEEEDRNAKLRKQDRERLKLEESNE